MPELIAPTADLHASWLEPRDEWGRGVHQAGSGLHPDTDVDSSAGFAAWVADLRDQSDPTVPVAPGRVPATYWWIVDGLTYLGAITLRHELNDFLLEVGGHIGYGVRPSARRRGLASWALAQTLEQARARALPRVLVTCDDTNLASARVIARNGGALEDVRDGAEGRGGALLDRAVTAPSHWPA
ncbi:MAG: GNAT family N-acetyltransferase [Nocardioidaceae bacterium]